MKKTGNIWKIWRFKERNKLAGIKKIQDYFLFVIPEAAGHRESRSELHEQEFV